MCRALMAEVVNELADLKVSWERKLKEISVGLEEVVALKEAQTEFCKLQQQQVELREELEVLSRCTTALFSCFVTHKSCIGTCSWQDPTCI